MFYGVIIGAAVLAMLGLLWWSVGEVRDPVRDDRDETP